MSTCALLLRPLRTVARVLATHALAHANVLRRGMAVSAEREIFEVRVAYDCTVAVERKWVELKVEETVARDAHLQVGLLHQGPTTRDIRTDILCSRYWVLQGGVVPHSGGHDQSLPR